jgi:hypothetical protein
VRSIVCRASSFPSTFSTPRAGEPNAAHVVEGERCKSQAIGVARRDFGRFHVRIAIVILTVASMRIGSRNGRFGHKLTVPPSATGPLLHGGS